jgi:hypothetical protein
LDRLAREYGPASVSTQKELTVAETQLRDYHARLGQPFPHDAYMAELTALRDHLRVGLSGNQPDGETPVAEVADKVKALRAANTIEAAPQRSGTRRLSAEEPVTARIRRRHEANPDSGQAAEHGGELGGRKTSSPAEEENASTKPPIIFQERIAMDRRGTYDGPSV